MPRLSFLSRVFLVLLGFSSLASAAGKGPWYFVPQVSLLVTDSNRNADNTFGARFALGRVMNHHFNLEAELQGYDININNAPGSFSQFGGMLYGKHFFSRDPNFSPFVLVGGGLVRTAVPGKKSVNPSLELGVGMLRELYRNGLALRTDLRYRLDTDDQSFAANDPYQDWMFNFGVYIPMGDRLAAPPTDSDRDGVMDPDDLCPGTPLGVPVDENGCELDSDRDGISDRLDRCPETPIGAQVNPQGCELDSDGDGVVDSKDRCPGTPLGTPVNAYGCELDSDGDGVVDSQDECPNTPHGAPVNNFGCEFDNDGDGVVDRLDRCPDTPFGARVDSIGCELDSDGDGVVDSHDLCPGTAPGTRVDVQGCPLTAVIILEGVNFHFDSDQLIEGSGAVLDDVVTTLRRYPDINVEVAGHTDATGDDAYNLDLSQRRANTVRRYLIGGGIARDRVRAAGYGETQPIADNNTPLGRASNRRVELHILSRNSDETDE